MTTTVFQYTGASQNYVVPAGVLSITFQVTGGCGAPWGGVGGGGGAVLSGTLPTTPGETLQINVGGGGSAGQGWNIFGVGGWQGGIGGVGAGGNGGQPVSSGTGITGNGGGGSSDIRQGGVGLANRVVVAGAGGGAANGMMGGGAGAIGGNGADGQTPTAGNQGHGGTQTAGGAGGGGTGVVGQTGTQQYGGSGANDVPSANASGGGGGGYWGGGGGGAVTGTGAGSAAGGGGSSFVGASVTGSASTAGTTGGNSGITNGSITIATVETAPTAPTALTPVSGGFIDVTNAIVGWTFNDPDVGDFQTAADVRYRIAGSLDWITVVAAAGTLPTFQMFNLTAGINYEWQVRAYDAQGVVGPYSSSSFFTAKLHPVVVVTSPTPGQAIGSLASVPLSWAPVRDQYGYTYRRVADDGNGNPDTSNVIETHSQSSATNNSFNFTTTTHNDGPEHWQVQVSTFSGQVVGDWNDVYVNMSVDAPSVPTCAAVAMPNIGAVQISCVFADMSVDYFIDTPTTPTVADTGQALTTVGAPNTTSKPGFLFAASTTFSQQATLAGKVLTMSATFRQENLGTTTHTNNVYIIATDASNNAHIYCGIDAQHWYIKKNVAGTLTTLASGTLATPITTSALNAYPLTMTAAISGTTVTFVDVNGVVHTATDAVIGSDTGTRALVQVGNTANNVTDDTWKVAHWSATSTAANPPATGFVSRSSDGVNFVQIPASVWDTQEYGAVFTYTDYTAPFNRKSWYQVTAMTSAGAVARSVVS